MLEDLLKNILPDDVVVLWLYNYQTNQDNIIVKSVNTDLEIDQKIATGALSDEHGFTNKIKTTKPRILALSRLCSQGLVASCELVGYFPSRGVLLTAYLAFMRAVMKNELSRVEHLLRTENEKSGEKDTEETITKCLSQMKDIFIKTVNGVGIHEFSVFVARRKKERRDAWVSSFKWLAAALLGALIGGVISTSLERVFSDKWPETTSVKIIALPSPSSAPPPKATSLPSSHPSKVHRRTHS